MSKWSSSLSPGLLLAAVLFAGYVLLVQAPIRARMEKVSDRAERLMEMEDSMGDYRGAQAGLKELSDTPLPELRKALDAELPGVSVRLEEGVSQPLNMEWVQRRTRVVFENCSLSGLHAWLLSVQQADTGWRLMSLDVRAESSGGYASGELELAGVERTSTGKAL